jgi:hypothetical protein
MGYRDNEYRDAPPWPWAKHLAASARELSGAFVCFAIASVIVCFFVMLRGWHNDMEREEDRSNEAKRSECRDACAPEPIAHFAINFDGSSYVCACRGDAR